MPTAITRVVVPVPLYRLNRHQGRVSTTDFEDYCRFLQTDQVVEVFRVAALERTIAEMEVQLVRLRSGHTLQFSSVVERVEDPELLLGVPVDSGQRTRFVERPRQCSRIEHRLVVMIPDRKDSDTHQDLSAYGQSLHADSSNRLHQYSSGDDERCEHNVQKALESDSPRLA